LCFYFGIPFPERVASNNSVASSAFSEENVSPHQPFGRRSAHRDTTDPP
jgi:hypothetical protein